MSDNKKGYSPCQKICAEEFTSCMQMALDTFSLESCFNAEKECEQRCKLEEKKWWQSTACFLHLCKKPCHWCKK